MEPQRRRNRNSRTTSSVVKTVATSAAVAYGAYRLAQWYWKDDEEQNNNNERSGEEHPLEEDLPQAGTGAVEGTTESTASPQESMMASSWLSVATDWLVDAATSSVSTSTIPTQNPRQQQQQQSTPTASPPIHHPPITGKTRRQRLMHCRQKTLTAFHACLPALQGVVEELTSTSQATRQLKDLRKRQKEAGKENDKEDGELQQQQLQQLQHQQDELWKQIVVENTTRMMASSYAYTLLLLSLTVQLHWISGNREMLLQEGQQSTEHSSTELAQSMLMQSHQYLVEHGIPLLVATIRRSVEATMLSNSNSDTAAGISDWTKPTQFMTIADVEKLLYQQIPRALKYGSATASSSNVSRNWVRFVLPDEECFDPIWDVCSSPVWEDAQEQILERLWYMVLRDDSTDGWKQLFERTSEHEPPSTETHLQQKPVAKIVAQFKKSSNLVFAEVVQAEQQQPTPRAPNSSNSLVGTLQKLPTVLELGEVSFQRHS